MRLATALLTLLSLAGPAALVAPALAADAPQTRVSVSDLNKHPFDVDFAPDQKIRIELRSGDCRIVGNDTHKISVRVDTKDPDKARDVWQADLDAGLARRDTSLPPLEVVAGGTVHITADENEAERLRDRGRPMLALYIGGMGAVGRNFYNSLFARYGYEAEAAAIQEAYLAGDIKEAESLIPDEYLRATSLIGDEGWVRDRINAYREAGVSRLSAFFVGAPSPDVVEKLRTWCG